MKYNKKSIDVQCTTGQTNQTSDYVEVFQIAIKTSQHKLRVKIHCDNLARQGYARIERWDGTKWQSVYAIKGENMKSKASYVRDCGPHYFQADHDRLLKAAVEVLS